MYLFGRSLRLGRAPSLFAGLIPREIESRYPRLWQQGEDDETSRNRFEDRLLEEQMRRHFFGEGADAAQGFVPKA